MDTYKGSLRVAATADVIEAVFEVSEESLKVSTGRQVLGTWALPDVTVEPRADGIHVSLDGENVIVTVSDPDAFTSALAPRRRRPKGRREKKRAQGRLRKRPVQPPAPDSDAVAVRPDPVSSEPEPTSPRPEPAPEPVQTAPPRPRTAPAPAKTAPPRPEPDPPMEAVVKPRSRSRQRRLRGQDIMNLVRQIPELFDPDNWTEWLQDRVIRWSIASVGVIVLALLVLFAANTLGMILVLLGMVALIIAALAVSDDLSAYRAIPSALSETGLVIAGAVAMVIGALLIVIG